MQSLQINSSRVAAEWRIPPNQCRLRHASYGCFTRPAHGAAPARHLAAAAAAQQEEAVVVAIPGSKEEAVSAAVAALTGQIKGLAGKRGKSKKGFKSGSSSSSGAASTRFSLELPLPSSSPADSAAFVSDVLRQLPPATLQDAVVVCAAEAVAAAVAAAGVRGRGLRVVSLQAACRSADTLLGPLVLVEPGLADVALVEQLLDEVWSGPWAVVLNPTWFEGAVPQQYQQMVDSWQAAYSLAITATQGLMRTEGAVLRQMAPGSSGSSSPWRVLLKQPNSDRFVQVGQMSRRPTPSDLELAFINAKAAQSPLTSLVKGVRGLFDRQQQQQ